MIKYKLLFLLLIIFSSCSKDSDSSDSNEADQSLMGEFNGTMNAGNGAISNNLSGNINLSDTGVFLLDVTNGSISGLASQEGSTYTLNNLTGKGIFENSEISNGILDLGNETLQLSGTYIDNTSLTVAGGLITVELAPDLQMLRDALDKSAVWFTHNELCFATITVDDITLEDLGNHYQEGGLCHSTYGGPQGQFGSSFFRPVDDWVSGLLCTTGTLFNPIEETYITYTSCPTAVFVVDKNTQHTYTVTWENGDTETGTFTSADGGAGVCFFLTNPSGDCSGGGGGGGVPVNGEILENTLIIDYTESNTPQTGNIDFPGPKFCEASYWNDGVSGIDFGEFYLNGSFLQISINGATVGTIKNIQELVYPIGELEDEASIWLVKDQDPGIDVGYGTTYGNATGTVEVTHLLKYPDSGGEVDLLFNSCRIYSFEGYYITFSGTLKARWAD